MLRGNFYTFYYNTLLLLCVLLLFQGCLSNSKTDQEFAGGSGTEESPYHVSTVHQLQRIAEGNYLDRHFIQINDIDASASAEFQDGWGFQPIGNEESPFTGSFDGGDYEISGLVVNYREKHTGLFGVVNDGTIRNTGVIIGSQTPGKQTNEKFHPGSARHNYDLYELNVDSEDLRTTGGLVGLNDGGKISYSYINGSVSAPSGAFSNRTGGLVGYNAGRIEFSYAIGNGSALGGIIGGLVGGNSGLISDSFSSFSTGAAGVAGGFAGGNFDGGQIINSYSSGNASGNIVAGGLVGRNMGGQIHSSYSTGDVSSVYNAGGVAGVNDAGGEILNSYALGRISGENKVGGITGTNGAGATIATSFAAGQVSGDQTPDLAGVAALNEGTINSTYWDIETSGQSEGVGAGSPDGVIGLSTQQMTGPEAETHMPDFDWSTIWRTSDGYPLLRWQDDDN